MNAPDPRAQPLAQTQSTTQVGGYQLRLVASFRPARTPTAGPSGWSSSSSSSSTSSSLSLGSRGGVALPATVRHPRRLARWPAASRLSLRVTRCRQAEGGHRPASVVSARDLQRASQRPRFRSAPCREPPRCAGSANSSTPTRVPGSCGHENTPGAEGPLASRSPSPFHPRRRGSR